MDWNNINRDRDTSGLGPIEYDQSKVPALIRKHADYVRTKTYGQEVREAQARNAEVAGLIAQEAKDISSETEIRQDTIEARYDVAVGAMTEDAEVLDARMDYAGNVSANLKTRLDNFEQKARADIDRSMLNEINIEDEPLVAPETVTGWINRVVNAKPRRVIKFRTGKTYYIQSPITITRSDVYLDFNWATLASQGVVSNQIDVQSALNVTIEKVFTTKTETDNGGFLKATNAPYLKVRNVSGFTTGFTSILNLIGVNNASISQIGIQNSNASKKGYGFELSYCVNVNLDDIYFGYVAYGSILRSTSSSSGYKNEGIHFNRFNVVKTNVGMQVDMCTQLTLSQVIFDFCSSFGVYVTNVNGMSMSQYWIGLQDGAVTGFENVAGIGGIFLSSGTIVGDWTKRTSQKAFYTAIDTPMVVNGVYLIDINGGNLDRSMIEVYGDYYFQSGQTPITKYLRGNVTKTFTGKTSTGDYFRTVGTYFTIYSVDKNNNANYAKSEGYINPNGALIINRLNAGGTGTTITHRVSDMYNIMLDSASDMTNYQTTFNLQIPEAPRYTRNE